MVGPGEPFPVYLLSQFVPQRMEYMLHGGIPVYYTLYFLPFFYGSGPILKGTTSGSLDLDMVMRSHPRASC